MIKNLGSWNSKDKDFWLTVVGLWNRIETAKWFGSTGTCGITGKCFLISELLIEETERVGYNFFDSKPHW
jgi:hypothetical protein